MASHDNGMLEAPRMFKAGQFPSWARPGLGGRGRTSYPKPLTRDRLKPISKGTTFELMDGRSVPDITQKLAQREKDISFLKTQHRDVLRGLHSEIERLKAENKELQFKLVMRKGKEDEQELGDKSVDDVSEIVDQGCEKEGCCKGGCGEEEDDEANDMQTLFEKELSDLRACLKEQLERNAELSNEMELLRQHHQKLVNQSISGMHSPTHRTPPTVYPHSSVPAVSHPVPGTNSFGPASQQTVPMFPPISGQGHTHLVSQSGHLYQPLPAQNRESLPMYRLSGTGLSAGSELQIIVPGQLPRPPTLLECEAIIRHLQQVNDKLQHELVSVRSDLRDVLYSSKWTPDAFLLAKKYVKDDSTVNVAQAEAVYNNYQQPDRPHVSHQTTSHPRGIADGVSLPPLKPNLENRVADRYRRQQATQKAIFRREILH